MSGRYERKKPQNQSTGGWKKTVLIVVLVVKPTGILGKNIQEKV